MFRAAILSIVVTLAGSPSAPLLCRVWCDHTAGAGMAKSDECHHHGVPSDSPKVAENDTCTTTAPGVVAFIREDTQRVSSAPPASHALVVLRYQLVAATAGDSRPSNAATEWTFEKRPLTTTLRV